jgi:hypothetical protein
MQMGLGMAKKAKQREAVALQEAIAAGMVKAKGRGKKQRAEKGGSTCFCSGGSRAHIKAQVLLALRADRVVLPLHVCFVFYFTLLQPSNGTRV